MTQNAPAFDITSDFPPDAGHIAELRLEADASRKEVDRRAGIIGRAAQIGMMAGGTAAAAWMWLDFPLKHALTVPAGTAEVAVWSAIAGIMGLLAAYILIQGIGGFYVAAGQAGAPGDEADLDELDGNRHPLLCIEFVRLCEISPTVRLYQNRLAAMGRRPVVAEVEAARQWAGERARQQLHDAAAARARHACSQLSGTI